MCKILSKTFHIKVLITSIFIRKVAISKTKDVI